MALLLSLHPSLLSQNPKNLRIYSLRSPNPPLSLSSIPPTNPRFPSLRIRSTFSDGDQEIGPIRRKSPIEGTSSSEEDAAEGPVAEPVEEIEEKPLVVDEWGEKAEYEEVNSTTKLSEADPPKDEDEWGNDVAGSSDYLSGNGNAGVIDKLGELKRCLVDSVYGTEYGFRASAETRAEVVELVNQLEAGNPTPAPMEEAALIGGNWVLLYTAFSELLPLIAAGTLPLLKLKRISQEIDTGSFNIKNTAAYSSPFATFSFSAVASFEVRSPSRIQVKFKEGVFPPPEISSSIDLPESIDFFGQKVDLLPVQRSLNPLQEAVANILRTISGQPPLKVPIPGERAQSWLVTTYLDQDLRISRGDGGLFVLVKEGSALLDQ
ncbi:hypothetical protein MRB53_019342 [Persea americana]|uniref:Uncharacterized protein n=1 Tax=Persea americana TaxID=3435 RepID=A0ACC2KY85_PERAE|nr:hypothetical protein MRB53_019342 [Persea americana]